MVQVVWKDTLEGLSPSNAGGMGLIPGWGTKIPHAMQHAPHQKKKHLIFFFFCPLNLSPSLYNRHQPHLPHRQKYLLDREEQHSPTTKTAPWRITFFYGVSGIQSPLSTRNKKYIQEQKKMILLLDLVKGHNGPPLHTYRSGLCKLSVTCHFMYSPLSQKLLELYVDL